MRTLFTVLAVILALGAAACQVAAEAFYGDLANAPALPRLVPVALGEALARPLGDPRAPAPLRAAYARALLHRGEFAAAAHIAHDLPPSPSAFELAGQLAEESGDLAGAVSAYGRARDIERAQRLIDRRDAAGAFDEALQMETTLAAPHDRAQDEENRARALWRMGQITHELAVSRPQEGARLDRMALAHYLDALAIAPNDETFLLAAGTQALTLGDARAALRYFDRAAEAVPDSLDAFAGMTRAALFAHDCARARASAAQVERLAPGHPQPTLGDCALRS